MVTILEMLITMMKTKRKPHEQAENLQDRRVNCLWPPRERFQRH